ncbi:hypothetical protein CHELA40_13081 [Chelatococcus asaccharovorans]|nr:hypothetical protein CHELA40_13081 [Chelatococcus asaccharovorans]CAH1680444.1 hypothetical protein CHELA17_62540 [Chelatococcus asaccharovorans]
MQGLGELPLISSGCAFSVSDDAVFSNKYWYSLSRLNVKSSVLIRSNIRFTGWFIVVM